MFSGYVEYERMESARSIFYDMALRKNVPWIAMINAYSKCGNVHSACYDCDCLDHKLRVQVVVFRVITCN